MAEDDNSFSLFDDLTADELALEKKRQQCIREKKIERLQQLSSDPGQRTIQENRLVFSHTRHDRFQVPQKTTQLLTPEECNSILDTCRTMVDWTTQRHSAFPTTDIAIKETPLAYLGDMIKQRLFPMLGDHFGFDACRDLAFRDIFIVKYSASSQRGLKAHTDGCLMSFNVLLSHPNDFDGGGTWFKSIDSVVQLAQGDCVYHDANIVHQGIDITRGERYILVGFVDTVDTITKDARAIRDRERK